jgi:hypothetical protein
MPVPQCKHGKLGRRKPDRASLLSVPRLATFLASDFPTPPAALDYRGGISDWGILANDEVGDCVIAAILHSIMARAAVLKKTVPAFTSDVAIGIYSTITGYNPKTGQGDNGTDMRTALEYWRTDGFLGNKIIAWGAVDPTNPLQIRIAMDLFGPLLVGVNLLKSAEDQTDQGLAWTPEFWTTSLGGHCVDLSTYGWAGYVGQTWGKDQDISESYIAREADELYYVVDPDWFGADGKSPTGLDRDGLLAASAKFAAAAA